MLERSIPYTLTSCESWRSNLNNGSYVCMILLCIRAPSHYSKLYAPGLMSFRLSSVLIFQHRNSNSVVADVIAKRARFFKVSPQWDVHYIIQLLFYTAILGLC